MLPVNEVFETIQGEATHAGTPSVFIRLQGCPVGCPWCDTRFTWNMVHEISPGQMLVKRHSGEESHAMVPTEQLMALLGNYRSRHVVITGGEPCMNDLLPLTGQIIDAGRSAQIETSGTFPISCDPDTWVTVSPKIAMPGGLEVRDDALRRANEIKMPIGKPDDVLALLELLNRHQHSDQIPIWLQPLSLSRKATELCVANAIANGFRVSLQVHALAGWR